MNRMWISSQIAVCSFAAVWLPFYIGGRYLGYDGFAERLNALGGLPGVIGFSGLLLILIDLWTSDFSRDDKFWWTVLGGILAPVAIPAYWFCYGLEHSIERWRGRLRPTVSLNRDP